MTIHRAYNLTLPELNRVLELVQKQAQQTAQTIVQQTQPSGGFGVSGTGTVGPQGPKGDTGATGAAGVANLDLLVVSQNEEDIIIVDESGNVVYDELGLGVIERHISWSLVTDDYGNIITAE